MPKLCYVPKRFADHTLKIVAHALQIIEDLAAQGYEMTARQIYYQMIALDLFPDQWIDEKYNKKFGLDPRTKNTMKNYKKFCGLLSDARRAGIIDWDHIVDLKRNLLSYGFSADPAQAIRRAVYGYAIDLWKDQPRRVEVWVEKDALIGVLGKPCGPWRVPHFSCSGYNSDSEMWRAAQRLVAYKKAGQEPLVIQLSDHDPSGKDMERDVVDRLYLFSGGHNIEVQRIALTMDQINEFNPPPNPAKESDSRYKAYEQEFGDESWELDALTPSYLGSLIEEKITDVIDMDAWRAAQAQEERDEASLQKLTRNWKKVERYLEKMA